MDDDSLLILLAMGPASAIWLYWVLYRYYRNTDKSHHFERETDIHTQPVIGAEADQIVNSIRGTQTTSISGDNVDDHRRRVRRVFASGSSSES